MAWRGVMPVPMFRGCFLMQRGVQETASERWWWLRQRCERLFHDQPRFTVGDYAMTLENVALHSMRPGATVPPHSHSYYELLVIVQGGAAYPGAAPQALQPGSMMLHAPYTEHSWAVAAHTCVYCAVQMTLDPAVAVPVPSVWPADPAVIAMCRHIFTEAAEGRPGWTMRAMAAVL